MLLILNCKIPQMDDKKICQDLEEDEELASLRLAALATLKSRENKKSEPTVVATSNILPINSITRTNDYSSEHSSRGNQSWRNNVQPSRRRTGTKHFPKSSQRSNLIVITPVAPENKLSSTEKSATPQLLLPQHKWCQAGNEDSSSPKIDRKTGPTRFNRHESGSESSDSDYDDSDDSYSNETVLQDECSRLTPNESNEDDVELKNGITSEHRLSFQNLEPDLNCDNVNKSSAVYNCVKNVPQLQSAQSDREELQSSLQPKTQSIESDCSDKYPESASKVNSLPNIEHFATLKSESTVQASSQKSKHTPIMFDLLNNLDHHRIRKMGSPDHKDNSQFSSHVVKDLRNNIDAEHKSAESVELKKSLLSKNDLRFELKKRKAYSERSILTSKQNKTTVTKSSSKTVDKMHRERSRSPFENASREHKNYKCRRSRNRSRTPERNRHVKDRFSSSRSSRSSSSSSSSSEISSDSSPRLHTISSVVQPIQSKIVVSDTQNNLKSSVSLKNPLQSSGSDHLTLRKGKGIEIKLKPISNIKISVPGNNQNNATEVKKRGPVHMRLGTLPRKRIIQMPKHIEAAFVSSTSSDEDNDISNKCKKSNLLVVTEMCGKKVDGISRHVEKKLLKRSDVPKTERGKVLR